MFHHIGSLYVLNFILPSLDRLLGTLFHRIGSLYVLNYLQPAYLARIELPFPARHPAI